MKRAVAVVMMLGCGHASTTTPTAPITTGVGSGSALKPAEIVWETPSEPWKVPVDGTLIGVDGDRAFVHGRRGMARFDLRTGRVDAQKNLAPKLSVYSIVHLRDGRWLAAGNDTTTGFPSAVVFDGETLDVTPIDFGVKSVGGHSASSHAAVLPDGSVVISGAGQPLAAYDPTTWKVKRVIDKDHGWENVAVAGNTLVARWDATIVRFDLATGAKTEVGKSLDFATNVTTAAIASFTTRLLELHETGKPAVVLDRASAFALDEKRLVSAVAGSLRVHELPSGKVVKTIPMPSETTPNRIKLVGNRAIFVLADILRVVDLETGTVSPAGTRLDTRHAIAVGDDGHVLLAGTQVWLLGAGKVEWHVDLPTSFGIAVSRDARRFVTSSDTNLELRAVATDKPLGTWEIGARAYDAWIEDGTSLVADLTENWKSRIVRGQGARLDEVATRAGDAKTLAVGGGVAMFALDGRVAVVDLRTHATVATLRIPDCESSGAGLLEPNGVRALTTDGFGVAVWDRTNAALLGSGSFARKLENVALGSDGDVVATSDDGVIVWRSGATAKFIPYKGIVSMAVSPNGKLVALGFLDQHVTVLDLAKLRASATAIDVPVEPAAMPSECKAGDPTIPTPEDDDDGG